MSRYPPSSDTSFPYVCLQKISILAWRSFQQNFVCHCFLSYWQGKWNFDSQMSSPTVQFIRFWEPRILFWSQSVVYANVTWARLSWRGMNYVCLGYIYGNMGQFSTFMDMLCSTAGNNPDRKDIANHSNYPTHLLLSRNNLILCLNSLTFAFATCSANCNSRYQTLWRQYS